MSEDFWRHLEHFLVPISRCVLPNIVPWPVHVVFLWKSEMGEGYIKPAISYKLAGFLEVSSPYLNCCTYIYCDYMMTMAMMKTMMTMTTTMMMMMTDKHQNGTLFKRKYSIRQIHTLSFKKPTVRVTSEFLGLAETWASSGKSPMTMTLVRSYQSMKNKTLLNYKHLILLVDPHAFWMLLIFSPFSI